MGLKGWEPDGGGKSCWEEKKPECWQVHCVAGSCLQLASVNPGRCCFPALYSLCWSQGNAENRASILWKLSPTPRPPPAMEVMFHVPLPPINPKWEANHLPLLTRNFLPVFIWGIPLTSLSFFYVKSEVKFEKRIYHLSRNGQLTSGCQRVTRASREYIRSFMWPSG